MKCPKCDYLGFETGDRCKNCGYDFSLTPAPSAPAEFDTDLFLHPLDDAAPVSTRWDGSFDGARDLEPAAAPVSSSAPVPSRFRPEGKLPLFSPVRDDGDEPLIKLPAAPRAPLAVRRTPESPRLRAVSKRVRPVEVEPEPELEFADVAPATSAPVESMSAVRARTAERLAEQAGPFALSGAGQRIAAAAIDHVVLSAIDVTVIYLTVRMAGLPMSGWTELPLAPLVVFLMVVKLSYFCVFTAVGGQTIGKMAMRIRVVTAENRPLDAAAAAVRSLAGTLSAVTLGLGYVPALLGEQRHAVHDRLARTRVVALPPV